jgi:hypothetical protein
VTACINLGLYGALKKSVYKKISCCSQGDICNINFVITSKEQVKSILVMNAYD